MANLTDNLTFLILCGGMGTRLGGQDKPLLEFNGRPMIEHVISSAPDLPLLISANRNLHAYRKYGPVFTDREVGTDISSPLNGVLGGLDRADTDWLLVAPGDSPCLPQTWWQPLGSELTDGDPGVVVDDSERQQNLHLVLNRSVAPLLRAYLRDGHGEVWRFIDLIGITPVSVPHPGWFINVNEREDFLF